MSLGFWANPIVVFMAIMYNPPLGGLLAIRAIMKWRNVAYDLYYDDEDL